MSVDGRKMKPIHTAHPPYPTTENQACMASKRGDAFVVGLHSEPLPDESIGADNNLQLLLRSITQWAQLPTQAEPASINWEEEPPPRAATGAHSTAPPLLQHCTRCTRQSQCCGRRLGRGELTDQSPTLQQIVSQCAGPGKIRKVSDAKKRSKDT